MSEENNKNTYIKIDSSEFNPKIIMPLILKWQPKKDITTYELALCLPYAHYLTVMPCDVDLNESHFRHFKIINPNK